MMHPKLSMNTHVEMNKYYWRVMAAAMVILVFLFRTMNHFGSLHETCATSPAFHIVRLLEEDRHNVSIDALTNRTSNTRPPPTSSILACQNVTDDGEPSRILYNRVPKCGSSSVHTLIRAMQRNNNFTYNAENYSFGWHVNNIKELAFVRQFCGIRSPMIFNRHIHYVDFTKFGLPSPWYINVIRDPIEHLRSYFYYIITNKSRKLHPKLPYNLENAVEIQILEANNTNINQTFDECILRKMPLCNRVTDLFTIIPFFCGQDEMCWAPSPSSLAKAKKNVESSYKLVGLTEDLETFVEGLEKLLPYFFKGASAWFNINLPHKNVNERKIPMKKSTEDYLRSKLREEYDFYHFIQQLFYQKVAVWRKKWTNEE